MWLFGIKHILTHTLKVLLQHKWSILRAAHEVQWITTDDPVIRLNYYSKGSYNFGGGWGYKGSEILLPLSPKHMLYTQVGKKNLPPRIELSNEMSSELQIIIAEHSHRWIFANEPIKDIENIRPRIIDPISYKNEIKAWKHWHEEQSSAEKKYIRKKVVVDKKSTNIKQRD